jgi:hypothetical protein
VAEVTLELGGKVLNKRIIDVAVGGLRRAADHNPLRHRREA